MSSLPELTAATTSRSAADEPTRFAAFAERLVESGWLLALVVVPAFFNVYAARNFEEEKILLLRALAVIILAGGLTWCAEIGRAGRSTVAKTIGQTSLVAPVLLLTAAYVLSTALSIAPRYSLWGAYTRSQGLYTFLSYVVVFFSVLLLGRDSGRIDRLVTVILLAGLPPALYGIMQQHGWDPVNWGLHKRVHGTAGNPIFLSAFLIMVLPLALARLVEELKPGDGSTGVRRFGRIVLWLAIVLIELLAVYYSQSRGPLAGLAVGVTCFIFLLSWLARARWPVPATLGAGAAATLLILAFGAQPSSPKAVHRLSTFTELESGTGEVRTLIWEGTARLLAAHPWRALIGFGPETMQLAYNEVYPPQLAHIERENATPDRAHNEVFDALLTTGAVGCLAELALFVAFFGTVLRRLGLLSDRRRSRMFVACVVGGAGVGAFGPYAATRTFAFSGLGLSLGVAVAITGYIAVCALRRGRDAPPLPRAQSLLLAALFAGVMGHFVEVQVGIATSITRLYLFTYAALAVACSERMHDESESDTRCTRPIVIGLVVALELIVLTFDLYTPTTALTEFGLILAGLFLVIWLFGATFVVNRLRRGAQADDRRLRQLGTYAAASIGPWAVFAILYASWIAATPTQGAGSATIARAFGLHLAGSVTFPYVAVLLTLLAMAAALGRNSVTQRASRLAVWQIVGCAVVLTTAIALASWASLTSSRADVFSGLGHTYEAARRPSEAVTAYEEAVHRWPTQNRYAVNLARVLMTRATRTAEDATHRDADATRAVKLMQAAARRSPLDPDPPSNLARIYRKWARTGDSSERSERLDRAEAAYKQALSLRPHYAPLYDELASFYLERGRYDAALQAADAALQIDPHRAATYSVRADALVGLGRRREALGDLDAALAEARHVLSTTTDPAAAAKWGRVIATIEAQRAEVLAAD